MVTTESKSWIQDISTAGHDQERRTVTPTTRLSPQNKSLLA